MKKSQKLNHFFSLGIITSSIFLALPAIAMDFTLDDKANSVLKWNALTLDAIKETRPGPTIASRALGIVQTSIFDAWAAYDPKAIGTQLGNNLQVKHSFNTPENKTKSISFAAYTTLKDLFPTQVTKFDDLMTSLGYTYTSTTNKKTAEGIGNLAANANLLFRHFDGSNQLNGYADTSGYQSVNSWDKIINPNRWQPLSSDNGITIQKFLTPHWGEVTPFGFKSGKQFLPPPPALYGATGYINQAMEIIEINATLTDKEKVTAEYWSDGPGTVLPPGHWQVFAEYVSQRDEHSLDSDVKMFFALGNAVSDAGIAAWNVKKHYDYIRPISAIRYLAANNLLPDNYTTDDGIQLVRTNAEGEQEIYVGAKPDNEDEWINGEEWVPYLNTPPFPECVSGHSTFSAASAYILQKFTGSDDFGASYIQAPNSSFIEENIPSTKVKLVWDTFSDAASEAGMSRLYGGIHFSDGNVYGQDLGAMVGDAAWKQAQYYINGGDLTAVPEPLTIFGTITATGMGVLFKRKYAKKSN